MRVEGAPVVEVLRVVAAIQMPGESPIYMNKAPRPVTTPGLVYIHIRGQRGNGPKESSKGVAKGRRESRTKLSPSGKRGATLRRTYLKVADHLRASPQPIITLGPSKLLSKLVQEVLLIRSGKPAITLDKICDYSRNEARINVEAAQRVVVIAAVL